MSRSNPLVHRYEAATCHPQAAKHKPQAKTALWLAQALPSQSEGSPLAKHQVSRRAKSSCNRSALCGIPKLARGRAPMQTLSGPALTGNLWERVLTNLGSAICLVQGQSGPDSREYASAHVAAPPRAAPAPPHNQKCSQARAGASNLSPPRSLVHCLSIYFAQTEHGVWRRFRKSRRHSQGIDRWALLYLHLSHLSQQGLRWRVR